MIAPSLIHPAEFVFIVVFVKKVRCHHNQRSNPAQDNQTLDQGTFIRYYHEVEQNSEKDSLTQHPEVGGHHEVGGDHVQQPAPDQWVNQLVSQNVDHGVQGYPEEVVTSKSKEHVLVYCDTGAVETGVSVEYDEWGKYANEWHAVDDTADEVEDVDVLKVWHIHTVCIVGPRPVNI